MDDRTIELRPLSLRLAAKVPRDRTCDQHERCVYCNFADVWDSWEEFLKKLDRVKMRLRM